jgi:hypothetical protein
MASFKSRCPRCRKTINQGDNISQSAGGAWTHTVCPTSIPVPEWRETPSLPEYFFHAADVVGRKARIPMTKKIAAVDGPPREAEFYDPKALRRRAKALERKRAADKKRLKARRRAEKQAAADKQLGLDTLRAIAADEHNPGRLEAARLLAGF